MASCLGLYVEDNIIKYAKVSKSNEATKVESFGMKFYDNLQNAIKQIVQETYSFKLPISINMSDEIYNKFEVFSLLSKNDMDGVIKTEFENICYDKDTNPSVYEQRHIIVNPNNQNEKVRILHISASKASIAQRKNQFSEYKITNLVPIGVTIQNLVKKEKKTTTLVVNIEKNTTITKITNNSVSDVNIFPIGAQNIIENINKKENSYAKAYEICKNTTIYTEQDKDLQYEENEYLVDIMPVLYQIATEVRKITQESLEQIEKIYITGMASVINNIDIYFQEYLGNINCEVLKPSFIGNNSKVNIKDYIEVNSAISVAIYALDKKADVNFIKASFVDRALKVLKSDVSIKNINVTNQSINEFLNKFSRQYNTFAYTFALIVVFYLVASFVINKQLENKIMLADTSIQTTNNRINKVGVYNSKFNEQISDYERLIRNIENLNNVNSENKRYRNTIPNLLNNIMAVIPKSVQLTSIENTVGTHIVITAKSPNSEQIAFFKTKLKTEEILKDVVSDTGTMQGGNLTVTIQGELP